MQRKTIRLAVKTARRRESAVLLRRGRTVRSRDRRLTAGHERRQAHIGGLFGDVRLRLSLRRLRLSLRLR
jgi:hypothetical protein